MTGFERRALELIKKAKLLIKNENEVVLETIQIIGEINEWKIPLYYEMNQEEFAEKILGLTPSQYWKRVAAAHVYQNWPDILELTQKGKLPVSTVAVIASKLTPNSKDIILENVMGKTKREAEEFVRRIDRGGNLLPDNERPLHDIRLKLSEDQFKRLERAREVSCGRGQHLRDEELLIKAVEVYLDRHDPMRKAERAEKRNEKKTASREGTQKGEQLPQGRSSCTTSPQSHAQLPSGKSRSHIPRETVHQIWLRDGGRCTHRYSHGGRCTEKAMLEIDHIHPVCRGGGNELENLRLLCRFHNQMAAETSLGKAFMEGKRMESSLRTFALS